MAVPTVASSPSPPPQSSYRPQGALDLSTALAPYAGPWGTKQAAHLLRRAAFGGAPDDVTRLASGSMHAAVDSLVRFANTTGLADAPNLEPEGRAAARMLVQQFGGPVRSLGTDQQVAFRKAVGQTRRKNAIAMQMWWLGRMINSPAPLQEKMTLFWHGHFTSSHQKGVTAAAMVAQNQLFRKAALGDIRDLTQRVSQDPAMLRYLDNDQNRKEHPNENYARELMELFTLGIGNYSEADVRESARAFSGWTIGRDYEFVNNAREHDDGAKTFLGHTGNFAGNDIVNIIFEQPAAARWFAQKLLAYFVYSDPEPGLIDATAALIKKNDFVLLPVMSTLLRSNLFYSDRAYRALVKSPVEFVVGSYQLYGAKEVDQATLGALRRMSQVLFYPPNVKGWDGGAQWLNSQTLLTRENFASSMMVKMGDAAWIAATTAKREPIAVAQTLTQTILQDDVSPASRAKLVAYLNGAGVTTDAMLSGENADERVRGAAYLTMAMPAYQLA